MSFVVVGPVVAGYVKVVTGALADSWKLPDEMGATHRGETGQLSQPPNTHTGRPRANTYHHPEKHLTDEDDDGDGRLV
jgi:hypothetical protein